MKTPPEFNEATATPEELWDYCLREYNSRNPAVRHLLRRFFKVIGRVLTTLDRGDRVLEVGCGAGESSRRILALLQGQHYEISEYDPRYVEMLRRTDFPIQVTQESVYELQRRDGEFDCILMLEVLEHLTDYRRALREVFRVSRKHVIISVPNEPLWSLLNILRGQYVRDLGNTPGHVNRWGPRAIRRLIEEYGVCRRVYTPVPWIVVHAQRR